MEVNLKITTKLAAKLKFEPRWPLLAPRPMPHSRGMRRAYEPVITEHLEVMWVCLEQTAFAGILKSQKAVIQTV